MQNRLHQPPIEKKKLKIMLLSTSYNGLTQRAHAELIEKGHDIFISLAISDEIIRESVSKFSPDLIICPFLTKKIPDDVWKEKLCIIIHPGIKGDRGPSSIDWAIKNSEPIWGVTAIQACEEMDAGDIWGASTFELPNRPKSSVYRHEVTDSAIKVIHQTIENFCTPGFTPMPLDYSDQSITGRLRPVKKQKDRCIDWSSDSSEIIVKKIHASDSSPGVLDTFGLDKFFLYGAHIEKNLKGNSSKEIIGRRHGAVCLSTVDGAVWITHMRKKGERPGQYIKLPAVDALGEIAKDCPEIQLEGYQDLHTETFQDIWYTEKNRIGYLHFEFYNGAFDTGQCNRLTEAYKYAAEQDTLAIVLMGGSDFWSNGIHLNQIENAKCSIAESELNINAIDDFVYEVITTTDRTVVSAIRGNAGAGGVMMALAADLIITHESVVFNPHYETMGLFGSEYWTYLLPKKVGPQRSAMLTKNCLPIGSAEAKAIDLVDIVLTGLKSELTDKIVNEVNQFINQPAINSLITAKKLRRETNEKEKPLESYRATELSYMADCFTGNKGNYPQARKDFVYKSAAQEIPAHLMYENIIKARLSGNLSES